MVGRIGGPAAAVAFPAELHLRQFPHDGDTVEIAVEV